MVAVFAKLTVNLTERASKALDRVAALTGDTKTDTVNRAFIISELLHSHREKGGDIILRHRDGTAEVVTLV